MLVPSHNLPWTGPKVWLNLNGVGSLGLITAVGVTATWLPSASGDGVTQCMATGIHSSPEAASAWFAGGAVENRRQSIAVATTAREADGGEHAVGLVGERAGGCRCWPARDSATTYLAC